MFSYTEHWFDQSKSLGPLLDLKFWDAHNIRCINYELLGKYNVKILSILSVPVHDAFSQGESIISSNDPVCKNFRVVTG